jgi:hypothetical protein
MLIEHISLDLKSISNLASRVPFGKVTTRVQDRQQSSPRVRVLIHDLISDHEMRTDGTIKNTAFAPFVSRVNPSND